MNRDLVKMLEYEAKRRPEIAEMMARESMTEDEIRTASVPLPWFRQALIMYFRRKTVDSLIGNHVTFGFNPNPVGNIMKWTGGETFVPINQKSEIQMKPGDLFWVGDSGEVWLDTIQMEKLPEGVLDTGERRTKVEYSALVRLNLEKRYAGLTVPDLLPKPLFSISRG